ncbi:hypothetical protein PC128_g5049 [Phytophthora cactorum]|nr:hypothetical protein PC128_g5049 [Phytophthora cactorum]
MQIWFANWVRVESHRFNVELRRARSALPRVSWSHPAAGQSGYEPELRACARLHGDLPRGPAIQAGQTTKEQSECSRYPHQQVWVEPSMCTGILRNERAGEVREVTPLVGDNCAQEAVVVKHFLRNEKWGMTKRTLFRISDITAQRVDPAGYSTPRLRIDTPKVSGEVLMTSEVRSRPET